MEYRDELVGPHESGGDLMKTLAVCWLLLATPALAFATDEQAKMERVTGIGGLFFRSEGPDSLAKWYQKHLGISLVPTSYEGQPWMQEAGPTVFAPFNKGTTYFGDADKAWMINFRVRDLDAMVAQLQESGIKVEVDPELYPNGRFARLTDPEGNPIQLWEPQ